MASRITEIVSGSTELTDEEKREAELEAGAETGEGEEGASDDNDESGESNGEQEEEENEGEEGKSEHIVVSIGEEGEPKPDEEHQPAPQWVKDLRKQRREDAKRIKELEGKLENKNPTQQEKPGTQPTIESASYDAKVYETKLSEWFEKKRKIELGQETVNKAKAQQQEEHAAKYNKYNTDKVALKVPDFDEAEDVVIDILSETQQGAILQGSSDPALLVYALGKNEAQARKLAEIKDPVKFIFAAAKVEAQLKVSNRKKKPKPEGRVNGSGRNNSAVDSTLERLRKESEKSGDLTKVVAYNREKKNRSAT